MQPRKLNIGVLISGGGSNLQAIIDACSAGRIHGRIVFVGSDNPQAKGLERAQRHRIPCFSVDYSDIERRAVNDATAGRYPQDLDINHILSTMLKAGRRGSPEKLRAFLTKRLPAEVRLLENLTSYRFDLLVLAGFMRTLTPYFIDHINQPPGTHRIMNIHPALLPAFPGVDGYGDTFRYGCKVAGSTVHFVDYGEDTGPIIGQTSFTIEETDDLAAVKKKGLAKEWQLYPRCLQYAAEGRLQTEKQNHRLKNGKVVQRTVVKILPKAV